MSHSEVLGNEQLLTCKLSEGDHLVQVRADPDLEITAGQRLHLDPDPSGWRLFDRDGEAIRLPRQPAPSLGPNSLSLIKPKQVWLEPSCQGLCCRGIKC